MAYRSPVSDRPVHRHDLFRRLVAHLEAQEAALLAFRSLLHDLATQPLSQMDRRRLKARLDASGTLSERLHDDRELLLDEASASLRIPVDAITLSVIIAALPAEHAGVLAGARRRLQRVARQVQRQIATVDWILSEERHLNFLIYQLLGGERDSERYDASGRRTVQQASLRFGATS
ncbi:MAG: hypothetical protein R3C19_14315 [Planctomycetaceae bacterium]